jgi:hypothetical protein
MQQQLQRMWGRLEAMCCRLRLFGRVLMCCMPCCMPARLLLVLCAWHLLVSCTVQWKYSGGCNILMHHMMTLIVRK